MKHDLWLNCPPHMRQERECKLLEIALETVQRKRMGIYSKRGTLTWKGHIGLMDHALFLLGITNNE